MKLSGVAYALAASVVLMFSALTPVSAGCYGDCTGYVDNRGAGYGYGQPAYSEPGYYDAGPRGHTVYYERGPEVLTYYDERPAYRTAYYDDGYGYRGGHGYGGGAVAGCGPNGCAVAGC